MPVLTVRQCSNRGVERFTGPFLLNNSGFTWQLRSIISGKRSSSTAINTTNLVMAASLLSVLPILVLYFLLQKYLIGGIASVGLKG
jgi:ABC-type glycerol-3-phosphate transport system permease component